MAKYSDYSNFFSVKNAIKLLKYIRINHYIIKLEENKLSFFGLIYNLELVKLKTLKI